jgi:hypothetical protein
MDSDFSLQPSSFTGGDWPPITCLCPTYGRFERLRDAVACFLLQDYPGEKELLILNDAPKAINVRAGFAPGQVVWASPAWHISVTNAPSRLATLGHKRQALLEDAGTPLMAHWDDDDLYLPWHLSMVVSTLLGHPEAACAKPRAAWWVLGPRTGPFDCRGIHHNVFEGQMVFYREAALALGGYPPLNSGQAKALLDAFKREGQLYTWNPADTDVSYVYRWGDGADHVSARRGPGRDTDFGNGQPLIPSGDPLTWAADRLQGQFPALADAMQGSHGRLNAWLNEQEQERTPPTFFRPPKRATRRREQPRL